MQRARVLVAVSVALVMAATMVTPSAAATTSVYHATFTQEQTVQRTCPPGLPSDDFCFTGSDHSRTGQSSPPVPIDLHATEDFAGFVDFHSPQANACPPNPGSTLPTPGYPDHNVVTIGTYAGNIFMTTTGLDCMSTGTDDGTWQVIGGTGIFSGATGTGHVHTQATGGTGSPTNPITSFSTYTGTITLR